MAGENSIIMDFMNFIPHQILLGWSTQCGSYETGMWHTWGKRQIVQGFGWQKLTKRDHWKT